MDAKRDDRRMLDEEDDRGNGFVQHRLVQGQLQVERRLIGHQGAIHHHKWAVLSPKVREDIGKAGFDCNHMQ
jgi:hypothetical protein